MKRKKNTNDRALPTKDISYHLFKATRKKAQQKPLALFSLSLCLCLCGNAQCISYAYGMKYKHIKLNWQYFPYLSLLISSCRLHASPSTRTKHTSATILCFWSLHNNIVSEYFCARSGNECHHSGEPERSEMKCAENEKEWNEKKQQKTRILSKQPSLNVIEIRVTGKRAEHINEEKQMKSKCFINSIVGNCFQHINVLVFRCIKYIFSRQSVTSTSTFNQKMTMTAATTTKRNG